MVHQYRLNGRNIVLDACSGSVHVVDDLATAAMVASGFGVCIMPELVMRDIPYDVKSYPLQPAASRMIGLAALTTQFMAPAVRTLYRHILEYCRNL